jgi:uncharacterized delta-60 repeat protein
MWLFLSSCYLSISTEKIESNSSEQNQVFVKSVTTDVASGSYSEGALITMQITFSENVFLNSSDGNNPILELELNTTPTLRSAIYNSGSGTAILNLTYTVAVGDQSAMLDYLSVTALTIGKNTSLQDSASKPVLLMLPIPGLGFSLAPSKYIIISPTSVAITTPSSLVVINNSNQNSFDIGGTCSEWNQPVLITATDGTTILSEQASCTSGNWSTQLDLVSLNNSDITISASHTNVYNIRTATNAVHVIKSSIQYFGKVQANIAMGLGSWDMLTDMHIQNDGKILVVGSTEARGFQDFVLVRYNSDGTIDSGFGDAGKVFTDVENGSEDYAGPLQIQSDGKILLAGSAYLPNHADFILVRYATSGTLDETFGTNGKVVTDIGTDSEDQVTAMQIQSDGKILVAGYSNANGSEDFSILRFTLSGALDTSFGVNGKVLTDINSNSHDYARSLQIQNDGKILVSGYSYGTGTEDLVIVRYNSDGTLDMSFGTNGVVRTDVSSNSNDKAFAMQIQSDNKILIAGASNANSSGPDFMIARYTTTGSLDLSFNSTGIVTTDFDNASVDEAAALKILSDGKILVSGYSNINGFNNFAIARYTATGSLDTSFDIDGMAISHFTSSSTDTTTIIQIQSDGKILIGGNSTASGGDDFAIARYSSIGDLDTSFNGNGKLTTNIGMGSNEEMTALKIQSDGKILVAGVTDALGSSDFLILRYTAEGVLDSSFGLNGKVITDIGTNSYEIISTMQIQSEGKILVAGYTDANSPGYSDFALVRYTSSGSLDQNFGVGGKVITDFTSSSYDWASAMQIQSDGKILVAGYSNISGHLVASMARYTDTGVLDTSFDNDGKVTTDLGANTMNFVHDIKIQNNGKILLAGVSYTNYIGDFMMLRYDEFGTLDNSFGTNGIVTTDIGTGSNDAALRMQIQSNEKILLAGSSDTSGNSDFVLARYTANGILDTSFGSNGVVLSDVNAGTEDTVNDLHIQADGKILVAGASNTNLGGDFAILQYNADGSLDSSFGTSGLVRIDISTNSNDSPSEMQIQADGKILVGGTTRNLWNFQSGNFVVIRLTTSGVLD